MSNNSVPVHRTFAQVLQAIRGGDLHQDLTDKFMELAKLIEQHRLENGTQGAKGKITLEMSLACKDGALHIDPKITVKKPLEPTLTAMLFSDGEGNLTSLDPRQRGLFEGAVREVDDEAKQTRELS